MESAAYAVYVDAGNSRVKFAARAGRSWIDLGHRPTAAIISGKWSLPAALRSRVARGGVKVVWVSSVVPKANGPLGDALRSVTGRRPVRVDHQFRLPFRLRVPRPAVVGIDRICAAAGAVRAGRRSVIVVDIGSAITVDLVDRGAYRGGVILAGPSLSLRCLGAFAAKLPVVDLDSAGDPFPPLFGTTANSMILGASLGAVGAIRESVARLRSAAAGRPGVVVTGGGAPALVDRLPAGWKLEPHLVYEGLHLIHHLNPSRA